MNIYGASGHGKVIMDLLLSLGKKVDYVLDDNPKLLNFEGYSVQHQTSEEVLKISTVLAIGNNSIRKKVSKKFKGEICHALLHKEASISPSAQFGSGTVVMANVVVNAKASIGKNCILNSGSIVEHEVILKDFVHVSPGAVLTGNVQVKEGTHIGAGAVIIPGIKIGKWVTVGAGAVILKDVPDFAVVVGNPGKIIKYKQIEHEY